MAFNKNSNLYIVIYSTIMVVVVASLLAIAAMSLQPRQQANMLGEKKSAILSSLNAEGEQYDNFITSLVLNAAGEVVEGDALALLFDLKGAFEAGTYPIFQSKDGRVVIPVYGSGLWGPIWGYVALEKDMNTVAGVVFGHAGETPGLGAEISTAKHQNMYKGKQIFKGEELVAVTLRKGGATEANILHEVDAITGGTKTSDGVSLMLLSSLKNYLPYLKAKIAEAEVVAEPVVETEISNEIKSEEHE